MTYLLLLQKIREASAGVLTPFMLEITSLGEALVTYLLLAAVYWCMDKRVGQLMAWNVSVGCWLNQWTKRLWKVERPWVRDARITPVEEAVAGAGGYSMPSGHTARTAATWGVAGYSAWKKALRGIAAFCLSIVAVVMFSRNYLGVHTPQDVFVALGMGIVILIVTDRLLSWVDSAENSCRDIIIAGMGCVIIFLPMLKYGCLSNAGASFGFIIGWVLERRLVRFEVRGSWQQRMLRFLIGAAVLFPALTSGTVVLSHIVPAKYAGFFLQGFVAFFIMFLYPLVFKLWENAGKRTRKKIIAVLVALLVLLCGIGAYKTGCHLKNAETETASQEEQGSQVTDATETGEPAESARQLPKIVAHRGYSGVAPENTLDAFAKAVDIGADMIELDVQRTADGEIVVFHDTELSRITGAEGMVSEWSYDRLQTLDAGNGEHIPTLAEVLDFIQPTELGIYLELKDIGEAEGFAVSVAALVEEAQMQDRVLFASFNYQYLQQIREADAANRILCNTKIGDADRLLTEYPADAYGLWLETLTQDTIRNLQAAGSQVYVWTVNTVDQMENVIRLGADGIVTNEPGMALVAVHEEYSWLPEHALRTIVLPVLYDNALQDPYANDYIVQGMTKIGNQLLVSAYDSTGDKNSILYRMDIEGNLAGITDLGFQAHVGGIAYDEAHGLLWVTGAEGTAKAISSASVCDGIYQGTQEEILVDFDAGLTNHNGSKVASFLTVDNGMLYVGSYVKGATGILSQYDIRDPLHPAFVQNVTIPECIQGITFVYDARTGQRTMLLSQGQDVQDAALLVFDWTEETTEYTDPLETYVLPEGVEQIQMSADGLWMLFESAVRPYRDTCRVPNDHIWLVRWDERK